MKHWQMCLLLEVFWINEKTIIGFNFRIISRIEGVDPSATLQTVVFEFLQARR